MKTTKTLKPIAGSFKNGITIDSSMTLIMTSRESICSSSPLSGQFPVNLIFFLSAAAYRLKKPKYFAYLCPLQLLIYSKIGI